MRRWTLTPCLLLANSAAAMAADPAPLVVRLERVAAAPLQGSLVGVDEQAVEVATEGGLERVPVAAIRRLDRDPRPPDPQPAVLVSTTDGSSLSGTDFVQEQGRAIVVLPEGRIELPIERVRRVAWVAAGEPEPEWFEQVPRRPAGDLVVVRRESGHAFVEAAIVGVSADSVTVVLDGETIPVKRAKVLGVEWLREDTRPGPTRVTVAGGRLTAGSVEWSPEALVLDDSVRLPAAVLGAIDYAAGRTTFLADLPPETSSFEPFFGALAEQPGLAAFFAPRTVPGRAGDTGETIVLRPRTIATWRVPADSRRFSAVVERDVPAQAAAAVDVSLAVDGAEVFRRRLGGPAGDAAEPVPIELDVAGGRRLAVTIDFVAGGIGCGVRLSRGAFEK